MAPLAAVPESAPRSPLDMHIPVERGSHLPAVTAADRGGGGHPKAGSPLPERGKERPLEGWPPGEGRALVPPVSRDDAEGLLLEEEGHSDLISFQPTDSDLPSFLEDCNRVGRRACALHPRRGHAAGPGKGGRAGGSSLGPQASGVSASRRPSCPGASTRCGPTCSTSTTCPCWCPSSPTAPPRVSAGPPRLGCPVGPRGGAGFPFREQKSPGWKELGGLGGCSPGCARSRESEVPCDRVARSQRGARFPPLPVLPPRGSLPSASRGLDPLTRRPDSAPSHVRDDQDHAGVRGGDLLPGQLCQPAEQLPVPAERHQVGAPGDPRRGLALGWGVCYGWSCPGWGTEGPGHGGEERDQALAQSCGRRGLCEGQLTGTRPPALHSIALDPLYPSRCSWETFGYATSTSMAQAPDGLSPLRLSGHLNSLPCSLTFRQEETISIIRLIEQVGAWAGGGRGVLAGGGPA